MIAIGCDHGGFHLKQEIIEYLKSKDIDYTSFLKKLITSPFQQATASWYTDKDLSGITRDSSMPVICP